MTEKILAKAAGRESVKPGEKIRVNVDWAMTHDVLGGPTYKAFKEKYGENANVWDKDKIVVVPDHYVPNKDIKSAILYKDLLEFVKEQGITHFYPVGENYGVCHVMLPQEGFDIPGTVIVGTDSHTCTHGAFGLFSMGIGTSEMADVFATGEIEFVVPPTMRFIINGELRPEVMAKDVILQIIGDIGVEGATFQAMEFAGSTIGKMPMYERLTMPNMAIEAGATNGIMEVDVVTMAHLMALDRQGKLKKELLVVFNDPDAKFSAVYEYDASKIVPLVAKPNLPSNIAPAHELNGVRIDQAYIGSCTGGKLTDFIAAAEVLRGNKVAKGVRLLIVPSTQKVYKDALKMGLIETFLEAGGIVSAPTCGACLGGHMGVLAPGEKCISSTNRNFDGRMGDQTSEVYLASPKTVAASAITGYITPLNRERYLSQPLVEKPYMLVFQSDEEIVGDIPPASKKMLQREFRGKAFVIGNDINTDEIIPARYLNTADPEVLKKHAMEDLSKERYPARFLSEEGVCDYKIIIGGKNFGCGSSREHAPIALYHAGAQAVVAGSFARIFARNAIIGETILPLKAEKGIDLSKEIRTGDEVEIDMNEWKLINHTTGKSYALKVPEFEN